MKDFTKSQVPNLESTILTIRNKHWYKTPSFMCGEGLALGQAHP
jgi:hypothetical protein